MHAASSRSLAPAPGRTDAPRSSGHLRAGKLALRKCLDGGRLTAGTLEARFHWIVYGLPVEEWLELNALSRKLAGTDLIRVELPAPPHAWALRDVVPGLNALPALQHLEVPIPDGVTQLDLRGLVRRRPALEVTLRLNRDLPTEVLATAGTHLHASGAATLMPCNAVPQVIYHATDGSPTGVTAALCGVAHQRPIVQGKPVAAVNLNGMARFGRDDALDADYRSATIVCRHLAMHWLGASASGMAAVRTPASVARHVPAWTETRFRLLTYAPRRADTLCAEDAFGKALERIFLDMAATGHARRAFLLTSRGHAMGLKLHIDPAPEDTGHPSNWTVICYDPNVTTHELELIVHEPAALRDCSFALLAPHPSGDEAPVVALWRLDGGSTLPQTRELTETARAHPRFLSSATAAGSLAELRRALSQAPQKTTAAALDAACLIAFKRGRLDEAAMLLDALGRRSAASAQGNTSAQAQLGQRLHRALVLGHEDIVAITLRAIVARLALTEPRHRRSAPLAGDALFIACTNQVDSRMRACVQTLAHEIAASARCTDAEREYLLAGKYRLASYPDSRLTAAQAALVRRHPAAAAALLCGVLESAAPAKSKRRLLAATGVSLYQVLRDLALGPRLVVRAWVPRLLHAACSQSAGVVNEAELAALAPFMHWLDGFVPLGQDRATRQLLKAALLRYTGADLAPGVCERAGLRAAHLDSHTKWMVCSATVEVDELAAFRLRPGDRFGASLEFEGVRYLLPTSRLEVQADAQTTLPRETKPRVAPRAAHWSIRDTSPEGIIQPERRPRPTAPRVDSGHKAQ